MKVGKERYESSYLVRGDEEIKELVHHEFLLDLHTKREVGEDRSSCGVVDTVQLVEECGYDLC